MMQVPGDRLTEQQRQQVRQSPRWRGLPVDEWFNARTLFEVTEAGDFDSQAVCAIFSLPPAGLRLPGR